MLPLPFDIKEKFFQVLHGDININQFENWVYGENRLKDILSENEYLDLISFNYKKNGAMYELTKLLEKIVNFGEYETWKLRNLLLKALQGHQDLPKILKKFYDLYCRGYTFLDSLGIGYGLAIVVPPSSYSADNFDDLSTDEKSKLINSFYPALEEDIKKVLLWLDEGKIKLTGTIDSLGNYKYIDHR